MDELMKAIMQAVSAQAEQQTKSGGTRQKPFQVSFDIEKEAEQSAKLSKALFDAYVKVGFNEEQSFEMMKSIITAKRQ